MSGVIFFDNRLGFEVPTTFTNYLVIPAREEALRFIERLERFYAAHSDDEIASINEAQQNEWHADTYKKRPAEPAKRRPMPGYVYLLRAPNDAYKIGFTNNPETRFKTFEVRLPFEVETVCLIKTDDMEMLEKTLHNKFADRRINGEWFRLSTDDVAYIERLAS